MSSSSFDDLLADQPLSPEAASIVKAIARHERRQKKLHKRKSFKARVFEDFGGLCAYCLIPMRLHEHNVDRVRGNVATVDHVIPKARGGTNEHYNLLIVCAACNRNKGEMSLVAFLSLRKTKEKAKRNGALPMLTLLEKKYA
ncbi:MAG: HNH endonuclease [Candidatus Paceibacterota bacterium]|jgi:5-methylcytosine-specific restriction endonuclease McrA